MCGRITQQLSPDRIGELYGLRAMPLSPDRKPRYNGAPGQDFSACRVEQDGARAIVRLRWGLVPSWARDTRTGSWLINARAESV
ncbi:MAG: SOS response-associated peptidase family protein, partial [Bryobacterales bacterium]|nr:SOS response-associated peptidase family protein [Bryobacterales bacterium]